MTIKIGDRLPQALWDEYETLVSRLAARSPAMAAAE